MKKYSLDRYNAIGDFYRFEVNSINYSLNIKNKILIGLSIQSNSNSIEYSIKDTDDKILCDQVVTTLINKIVENENQEFKLIYPNYDSCENRDEKIDQLLTKDKETLSKEKEMMSSTQDISNNKSFLKKIFTRK